MPDTRPTVPGRAAPPVSTTLLLHRLGAADLGAVLALLASSGQPAERLRRVTSGGSLFALLDVAAPPREAVAAALVAAADPPGAAVELVALAVAPGFRRLGLGARLLREVIDVLRADGASCVRTAPTADLACGHLFRRAGFRPAPAAYGGGYELEL